MVQILPPDRQNRDESVIGLAWKDLSEVQFTQDALGTNLLADHLISGVLCEWALGKLSYSARRTKKA